MVKFYLKYISSLKRQHVPKINKYTFQNMIRKQRSSSNIFEKIRKANDILELFIKFSSFLLIIGIFLGSFFLWNYLDQYKIREMFSISIMQPNILLFIAISSFIFAVMVSIVAISGPYVYCYSMEIVRDIWTINDKIKNIIIDTVILLTPLSILFITSQHGVLGWIGKNLVCSYVVIAIILSLMKFFSNRPLLQNIDKEKIFRILLFMLIFVFSIIMLILPLYFLIKIIGGIELNSNNKEIIQLVILFLAVVFYTAISSIIINNDKPIVLTIITICYIIFVSVVIVPKEISGALIRFTRLGQFEVFLALDPKLNLLKTDNSQYSKFLVLINFPDSLVVSSNKDDKIFHVIPKNYIIDMKFNTGNDEK